jgi:DNA-binding transcriptional ArsR family regulator
MHRSAFAMSCNRQFYPADPELPSTVQTAVFCQMLKTHSIDTIRQLANSQLMDISTKAAALSHTNRLLILRWLKNPHRAFPAQVHGDKDRDGICGVFIADKLGVTPATASNHLKVLTAAGLIRPKRKGKYTYYLRIEEAIKALGADVSAL